MVSIVVNVIVTVIVCVIFEFVKKSFEEDDIAQLEHRLMESVKHIEVMVKGDMTSVNSAAFDNCIRAESRIDALEKQMNQHYLWSLGVWNDIADARLAINNPVPIEVREGAESELGFYNPSQFDITPMGPIND